MGIAQWYRPYTGNLPVVNMIPSMISISVASTMTTQIAMIASRRPQRGLRRMADAL